ncbi:MAG: Acetyltransferase family [Cyanobacteria bacterium RYN_339]|nr:Acetyltransferase family [Cyanobacteria bacterium RYN_339]
MITAEALADQYFAFAEHASWMCSVRVRNRLATLLAEDSPLVYRTDDAAIWLGVGSFFTLYTARSPEALAEAAPAAMAKLAPIARADGAANSQIFATSAGAVAAFEGVGYHVQHRAQRLRHAAPGPREIDPRVRAFEPQDLAGIVRVSQEVFPENHWTDEEWSQPVRNAAHVWVARDGEDIAAFLLADLTAERLFINGLAVAPTARRRGLASALVDRAIQAAHDHGRATVDVHANDTVEAMGVYDRAGFHVMHPIWDLGRDW